MKKFLTTAFAALAIISCEKPGSDVYDLTVHSFTAKGNSPSLTAKSGNTIDFTLNGDAFTATDGDITLPSETQAIVNYVIPSAYGEYLEMIIDVQDGGPVGITFKFWFGPESFYSFYFDQIETDQTKTHWIARASAGIVDEVTNDLGYTGMNVGDNLEGQVEISISKESAAAGTSKTDRVPEYSCNLPSLEEAADGAVAYAKRNGLSNASLQSKSWFTNTREWNQETGALCSRPLTVELTVETEIVYGESLCGENPINCKYTNDVQYKVWYRSLRLINGPVGIDLVMEDYGLSSMITVQNESN